MTDINPVLFPAGTPPDLGVHTITTQRSDDRAVIECALCREAGTIAEFPTVLSDGCPDRMCVRHIARHLYLVHNILHLARAARGE